MTKEQAKDQLIEVLTNQVEQLSIISKIELGDDVIEEIKRLKEIINQNKDDMKREWEGKKLRWEIEKYLKSKGITICAAQPDATALYTKNNYNIPIAIVLGNEHFGVSAFWKKNSKIQIRIPMYGKADSLNVSTTAAILIYETLRQRQT